MDTPFARVVIRRNFPGCSDHLFGIDSLSMNLFFKNVILTLRGAVLGQVIPIVLMPLVLRLYSPAEYGTFGSLMSLAAILSTFFMLQLELAVVLPKDEPKAETLAKTALQISVGMMFLCIVLLATFFILTRLTGSFAHISAWIMMAPIMAFSLSIMNLCNYISVRHMYFKDIGTSAASLHSLNGPMAIILGLLNANVSGLVLSRMAGQFLAIAMYRRAARWLRNIFMSGPANWAQMKEVLQEYRKFPLYSTPYLFLTTIAREATSIILIFFNHAQAAGFYTVVRMILLIPSSLLSTSMGQVFYREASRSLHHPRFPAFLQTLMLGVVLIMAPTCAYVAEWGPQFFRLIFGPQWADAGIYALILMPMAFIFTVNVWIGRIFEISNKQDQIFRLQVCFDSLSLAVLIGTLYAGLTPIVAISAFVFCQTVYFLAYLAMAFHIIQRPMFRFFGLVGVGMALAGAVMGIHAVVEMLIDGFWLRFALETTIVGGIAMGFLLYTIGRVHKIALLLEADATT